MESALLFVQLYMIFKLLEKYTVPNIRAYQRYFAERSVEGFLEEYTKRSGRYAVTAWVWGAVSLAYFIFYTFIRPVDEVFVLGTYAFTIIFIVTFSRALSYISDRVYLTIYKYS